MQLKNVAAVVTGGGSGLGAATARALAEAGAMVTVLDLDEPGARAVAESFGGHWVVCDHADEAEVAAAFRAAADRHGPARVLVNCAGQGAPGRRTAGRRGAYPIDLFRQQLEVNLVG